MVFGDEHGRSDRLLAFGGRLDGDELDLLGAALQAIERRPLMIDRYLEIQVEAALALGHGLVTGLELTPWAGGGDAERLLDPSGMAGARPSRRQAGGRRS